MKKITRREFLERSSQFTAAALLGNIVGIGSLTGCSTRTADIQVKNPNILLLMVDQQHTPPQGYGPGEGMVEGLKEILGFKPLSCDNAYTRFFPGFLRLRQNAVVLRTHYTASSACVPSRTAIMTGQYSTVTGVDQTDGSFKSPQDVPWLDPDGTPTIGDWFRAAGYTTHYFGKWHVSDPEAPDYLEPWGFADWEKSYPEPHGGGSENLGAYRDVGFADNVVEFLKKKGTDSSNVPWFAVGSLVNPHDCSSWPIPWELPADAGVVPWVRFPPPPLNPVPGQKSNPQASDEEIKGGLVVDLNPDGFPQDNYSLPSTFKESLTDKPRCQYDYSLKLGLMFGTMTQSKKLPTPYPFQLQPEEYSAAWSLAYNNVYVYLQYLMDLQLRRMLQALDDNHLADRTIVLFVADHGDMAGAHGGMIQKWHNAYEEAIHIPMVISSPLVNKNRTEMREILEPTSSIDLAPTMLALAGCEEAKILGESAESTFVGANLSPYVKGAKTGAITGADGSPRPGVLFYTNDTITEIGANPDPDTLANYNQFLANIERVKGDGFPLESGPVTQPNAVRALCCGDWKIARYTDPGKVRTDEWELYCLKSDPVEKINLVDFRTGEVRSDVSVPGMTMEQLKLKNAELKSQLARQESLITPKSG
ncbi:MAG: sulfatase-like hydrolase/transferase [Myxococcota bacterium]|jgi:arylsulfatase A-like enzyme